MDNDHNFTFSIVTPTLNQDKYISETIESVINQEGDFFIDYIIMDGGSKDKTIQIIKRYIEIIKKNQLPIKFKGLKIRYFSYKDKGQADAINNGLKIATGNIYSFLNSDDIYEKDTLRKISECFNDNPDIDIVYGNAFYIDTESQITGIYKSKNIMDSYIFDTCFICQPTLFMKSNVYDCIGPFNKNIPNSFDYEYWLRIYSLKKFKFKFLRDVLASSRMHKENKTTKNRKEIYYEYFALMHKYNHNISRNWKINFGKETSSLVKFLLSTIKIIKKPLVIVIVLYTSIYFYLHKKWAIRSMEP